ncbi:MAG: 4-(cytidine 5'-diphospho)-2-C-methyl-D-erythritol kinase [Pseudomonadota bacterium]
MAPLVIRESWPAPAKINRFLHVNGRRQDGYHLLQTLFQFVTLSDEIVFDFEAQQGISLVRALGDVPESEHLCIVAARALAEHAGTSLDVAIDVTKRIPMGGGLGGGSSDAATTLVALNALCELGASVEELAEIGLQLGADVPVFVHGVGAFAEGVGERLTPYSANESAALLVEPNCHVDTAEVFRASDLTRHTAALTMHRLALAECRNDCEPVTRRLHPAVSEALDWLGQFAQTRMSGTGGCVFALFNTLMDAERVAEQIPNGWRGYPVMVLNRSPLLDRLAVQREVKHKDR